MILYPQDYFKIQYEGSCVIRFIMVLEDLVRYFECHYVYHVCSLVVEYEDEDFQYVLQEYLWEECLDLQVFEDSINHSYQVLMELYNITVY